MVSRWPRREPKGCPDAARVGTTGPAILFVRDLPLPDDRWQRTEAPPRGAISLSRGGHPVRHVTYMKKSDLLRVWGRILQGHSPFLSLEITKECPLHCPGCY